LNRQKQRKMKNEMKQSTLNTIGIIALTVLLAIPAIIGCYLVANMGKGATATTTVTTTTTDSLQLELNQLTNHN